MLKSEEHFGNILKLAPEKVSCEELSASGCSIGPLDNLGMFTFNALTMQARKIVVNCGERSAVSWHSLNSNRGLTILLPCGDSSLRVSSFHRSVANLMCVIYLYADCNTPNICTSGICSCYPKLTSQPRRTTLCPSIIFLPMLPAARSSWRGSC